MIDNIVAEVKKYAEKWHSEGKELFEFDCQPSETPEYYAVKLLHHNYLIWHYIDLYKSPDSNTVLFVYDKGIEHNRYRNETIERLDDILCSLQKGTGKINSETIGSVIDRLGIHYIKFLHLRDAGDGRAELVFKQFEVLFTCAKELMEEMISGQRRCLPFNRFKIDYSENIPL